MRIIEELLLCAFLVANVCIAMPPVYDGHTAGMRRDRRRNSNHPIAHRPHLYDNPMPLQQFYPTTISNAPGDHYGIPHLNYHQGYVGPDSFMPQYHYERLYGVMPPISQLPNFYFARLRCAQDCDISLIPLVSIIEWQNFALFLGPMMPIGTPILALVTRGFADDIDLRMIDPLRWRHQIPVYFDGGPGWTNLPGYHMQQNFPPDFPYAPPAVQPFYHNGPPQRATDDELSHTFQSHLGNVQVERSGSEVAVAAPDFDQPPPLNEIEDVNIYGEQDSVHGSEVSTEANAGGIQVDDDIEDRTIEEKERSALEGVVALDDGQKDEISDVAKVIDPRSSFDYSRNAADPASILTSTAVKLEGVDGLDIAPHLTNLDDTPEDGELSEQPFEKPIAAFVGTSEHANNQGDESSLSDGDEDESPQLNSGFPSPALPDTQFATSHSMDSMISDPEDSDNEYLTPEESDDEYLTADDGDSDILQSVLPSVHGALKEDVQSTGETRFSPLGDMDAMPMIDNIIVSDSDAQIDKRNKQGQTKAIIGAAELKPHQRKTSHSGRNGRESGTILKEEALIENAIKLAETEKALTESIASVPKRRVVKEKDFSAIKALKYLISEIRQQSSLDLRKKVEVGALATQVQGMLVRKKGSDKVSPMVVSYNVAIAHFMIIVHLEKYLSDNAIEATAYSRRIIIDLLVDNHSKIETYFASFILKHNIVKALFVKFDAITGSLRSLSTDESIDNPPDFSIELARLAAIKAENEFAFSQFSQKLTNSLLSISRSEAVEKVKALSRARVQPDMQLDGMEYLSIANLFQPYCEAAKLQFTGACLSSEEFIDSLKPLVHRPYTGEPGVVDVIELNWWNLRIVEIAFIASIAENISEIQHRIIETPPDKKAERIWMASTYAQRMKLLKSLSKIEIGDRESLPKEVHEMLAYIDEVSKTGTGKSISRS